MITEGVPCSRKMLSTKSWVYCSAVISLVHGQKWTILVSRSTNTATAVYPSDGGKSVTKFVVSCSHLQVGIGIGCNNPAFFQWSDFMTWHTGQLCTYCSTSRPMPFYQYLSLTNANVLSIPIWPLVGSSWHVANTFCLMDVGTTNFRCPWSSYTNNPWGVCVYPGILFGYFLNSCNVACIAGSFVCASFHC